MNCHIRTIACALLAAGVLFACGDRQTMASKSADAYREAQAKGTPAGGGHEHGGHQAATATTTHGTEEADHAAHAAATDHAAMGHGVAAGTTPHDAHAAMQHDKTPRGADPHAQHRRQPATEQIDHSQHGAPPAQTPASGTSAHAHHGTTGAATASSVEGIAISAPRSNAEIRSVQPASTLRPDAFDAPAPISVSEAAKATPGGGAAAYACPMHPEVTSDKPGTCPKCGMALVKKN